MAASNGGARFDGPPIVLLFGFIVLAPLLETLDECVVPYWLLMMIRPSRASTRARGLVAVSGLIMALLHLGAWPSAILEPEMHGLKPARQNGQPVNLHVA
jgi:hypothetical protein